MGSISNGADSIAYGYDGSLVTSEHLTGTLNQALGYAYNNNFQVQSFSYAGGSATYAYDNDQLLTTAGAFTITRDTQNGLPTAVSDSKLNLSHTFNGYGEISSEKYSISNLQSQILNLSRNDNGQIITKQMTVNGTTSNFAYTYDPMGRLLTVTKDGALVEEYRYGANGARSYEMNALKGIAGRNYVYSDEDQLLTTGDFSYRYDVDGFLAIKTVSGTTTTYEYATRGELMKVILPDGNVIEYVNDPLGRRIAKKVNGIITEKYLWQGLTSILAIFDSSDNILMRFVYAGSRMPVAMESGGAMYYLAYDQVGSLRLVTDASGNVIKALDYDSFGNITQDTNPTFDMPFSFAGGMLDTDTGLIRFGFREYCSEIGRWTAKDPILFLGGSVDLYGYCLDDPINLIDPFGLQVPPSGHITITELLMAGRIPEALALAETIGLPIASKITQLQNTLASLMNKYPANSLKCDILAKKIADAFRALNPDIKPCIMTIKDAAFAENFFTSEGVQFAASGYHQAVRVGDMVYDALTGPAGMQFNQYMSMLQNYFHGVYPIIK